SVVTTRNSLPFSRWVNHRCLQGAFLESSRLPPPCRAPIRGVRRLRKLLFADQQSVLPFRPPAKRTQLRSKPRRQLNHSLRVLRRQCRLTLRQVFATDC